MMPRLAVLTVLTLLAGCQNPDPGVYKTELRHPYRVSETAVRLPLAGVSADEAAARVRAFAAERPNNGSSFIVSAPTEIVQTARGALLGAGIAATDIRLVPEGAPAEIVRIDRIASVSNCSPPVGQPVGLLEWLFLPSEGFRHDNAQGELFGCATRRSISEMVDDPRSLNHSSDGGSQRSGAAGARAYDQWTQGKTPAASIPLPTWGTGGGK